MHREAFATLGTVVLALGLGAPARADHEPWAETVHWRHHRPHHRHPYRHGYRRGYADGRYAPRAEYRCGPCQQRYADYGAFETHLQHRHHIPIWRIPQVIVEAAFGWIFYG